MMQNKALRFYLILINNTLNQSENDVENSEDDEPELKPEAQKIIPYEIEMDVLKCGQIYEGLQKPKDAERILLKGLEYFKDSYEIRKALSDIYRSSGDTKAAISITAVKGVKRTAKAKENSDSDYNPSEENEESSNKSSDEESDEELINDVARKRPIRNFNSKFKQNKRFKIGEEDINESELNDKIQSLKKSIYEDYNHGEVILNMEQAKIHYESNSSNKFISVLAPTIDKIIKRHFEIDTYVNLLRTEHDLKFKPDTEIGIDQTRPSNGESLFIQNMSAHKTFESDRLKKEKKYNLDKISLELEKLPNLYVELNEKAFGDCLYKLLSEVVMQERWKDISDEMIDNMRELEMFNRYPESPKVLMIYMCLFVILYKKQNYRESYRVIKRICRNYTNIKLFWGAFSSICTKLPRYSIEKVTLNKENTEFEYQQKHFSYRGHVQRIIDKYFKNQTTRQNSTLPLLQILLGNNYTQSRNYETAMVCYEKALESVECQNFNPLIYLLISACFLRWTTSRTNFDKIHTAIMAFKYLKIYELKKKAIKSKYSLADKLEFEYNIARASCIRVHSEINENSTGTNNQNYSRNNASKAKEKIQSLNSESFKRYEKILSMIPESYDEEDKERVDRVKRLCCYNMSQILCRGNLPKSTSSQNHILTVTEEAQRLLFEATPKFSIEIKILKCLYNLNI